MATEPTCNDCGATLFDQRYLKCPDCMAKIIDGWRREPPRPPPQTREQFAETGCTFSDEAWVRFNAQRQSIASLLQWQEAAYIRELRFQTRIDALTAENPTCLGHVPSNPAAPFSEQRCGRCGQSAPCEVRRMWILWGQMKRAAATFRAALDAYRLAYGDPASEPIQRDLTWAAAELDQADAKCRGETIATVGLDVAQPGAEVTVWPFGEHLMTTRRTADGYLASCTCFWTYEHTSPSLVIGALGQHAAAAMGEAGL